MLIQVILLFLYASLALCNDVFQQEQTFKQLANSDIRQASRKFKDIIPQLNSSDVFDTPVQVGPNAFFWACQNQELSFIAGSGSINRQVPTHSNIATIIIFDGITSIENYVFVDSNCTTIEIPKTVNSIGNLAFTGCQNLINISVDPQNSYYQSVDGILFSININALIHFPQNHSLIEYSIPSTVNSIKDYAFEKCTNLAILNIPSSVNQIGHRAFFECTSLKSYQVSKLNSNYKTVDGVLFSYAMDTLIKYPSNKNNGFYSIPNTVTTILDDAFENCTQLTQLEIPSSVSSIPNKTFTMTQLTAYLFDSPNNQYYRNINRILHIFL